MILKKSDRKVIAENIGFLSSRLSEYSDCVIVLLSTPGSGTEMFHITSGSPVTARGLAEMYLDSELYSADWGSGPEDCEEFFDEEDDDD